MSDQPPLPPWPGGPADPAAAPSPSPSPSLSIIDVENAVGSRLALVALGLAPPLLIEGRYRLLELRGRGARGVVCRAADLHLHREVALKLYLALEPSPAAQEVALEAQALARLRHPNVIGVFDFGDTSLVIDPLGGAAVPCFFMTMEYVRGESLRRWLARGSHDRDRVLAAFHQAGEGLVHAHESGVIHRDLKPENLMIAEDGRVLVVDFGLARHRTGTQINLPTNGRAPAEGRDVVGTPEYMAPEAYGGRADARSDQYGFALSLYEALVGSLPPTGRSGVAVARDRFPPAIAGVLTRALAFDPRDRFTDMRALLAALPRTWAEPLPELPLPTELPITPPPRRWLLGAGAALLTVTVTVILGRELLRGDDVEQSSDTSQSAAAGACLGEALAGNWKLRTTIAWDYELRDIEGRYYDLDLVVRDGCQLTGHLTKWLSASTGDKRLADAPVSVRPLADGRVELEGAWILEHNGPQTFVFTLEVADDHLRGDFELRLPQGRAAVLGAVDGTRHGDPVSVDDWRALPCRAQCRLSCAGDLATRNCELERCPDLDGDLDDCGAPGEDATMPATARATLEAWAKGAWKPASGGRACGQRRRAIAGDWLIHERAGRSLRRWRLQLRVGDHCTLRGTASDGTNTHPVRVEFDDNGRWLLRDPGDPRFVWGLIGERFVFGEGAGSPPTKLRGQRE